ncbi:dynein regulatory complex subunit 6 isoform X3 [Octopus bimaculoides]|nr:dynein regulatory complex subunit 6 isoform X3 [Octopus bimaculoides]XP_052831030.1 dynein regulatory complex subunit 6 isoform X3 [Octopus bimaculoides]|eukprot:XP_014767592.1 PREDICTED: F-box/LRR-repeat protein 13-like isoform X3 [Octopus bimaculoides]
MTALAMMCPEDPYLFIINKLLHIKEQGLQSVRWDMFLDETIKSRRALYKCRFEFSFEEDEDENVMRELFLRAYEYFNLKLKWRGLNAFISNWTACKEKKEGVIAKVLRIQTQRQYKFVYTAFFAWKEWTQQIVDRYAIFHFTAAQQLLDHVWDLQLCKTIFNAWHHVTLESIQQKEYFDRLEKGENTENEEPIPSKNCLPEVHDSISTLPYKVSVQIFSFLNAIDLAHCARVCRSWKVLTNASTLRYKLNLHEISHRLNDLTVSKLIYLYRPYLLHLNLRNCQCIQISSFMAISSCNNLQDLNLSNCQALKDDHLLLIARRCHILLYLNISHTLITDTALRIIARYLSNLLCLSLAYCRRFTDRGMTYLAQGECCKNLEHLDLSNCLQLTPEGFMQIFNKCDNLKVFIVDEFPTLTDQCIQSILLHCSKLEHISFLGSPLLTDAAFQKFPKTLKIIKLEGNNRISDMSIKLLSRMCPNVSHIYLADCQRLTDICLRYLATCKQLTILNLAECINITDAGIRSFSDGICAIKLRELNLSNCVHLGDMSLIIISKKLQNLTYLSLSFCDNISESSLEALGQAPNLISLDISGSSCSDQSISAIGKRARMKNINISQCTNITDLGLQKFAKQCPGLEQIDLSHCLQITDVAIKNLAFCCRLLSCVKLSGCKFITDLAPQYLSGVCHYLVQLDLNGCSLITDKGMKYVQKGCNWLRILNILYCKSISKSIVQKMKRSIDTVNYNGEECHPSLEC